MNRIPLIMWYGSVGATALIRDELKNGCDVDILSIDYSDVTANTHDRRRSMEKISRYFQIYDGAIRNHYKSDSDKLKILKLPFVDNTASITWIFHVMALYDPKIHSKVVCGITNENRFWHFKEDIMSVFRMMSSCRYDDGIIMEFPFEHMSSAEVAEENYQGGYDLLKLVSHSGMKGVCAKEILKPQVRKCA